MVFKLFSYRPTSISIIDIEEVQLSFSEAEGGFLMFKKKFFTVLSAVCLSFSLSLTPAFATDFNTIAKNISSSSSSTIYTLDRKYSSQISLNLEISQAVYNENPVLFLTLANWEGTDLYTENATGLTSKIKFSQNFINLSNDDNYTKSYWAYVDSVIREAGIKDTDSDATKAKKAALFIGRNYAYDYDGCYAAYKNGTPFFKTLTEKQKSFCTPDARLFMGCMVRLGIPAKYVEGEANGYHAWNKVFVNGKWSEVDVSFARKAKNKDKYIFFNSGRTIYGEVA